MADPAGSVIGLYDRRAAKFDADRTKTLFERPWLDAFTAPLAPGASVLDLGCLTADDQRGTIPRLAGFLKPGAPLMFTAAPRAGETLGEWRGEPLYHGGLDPDETTALLQAAGFKVLKRRINDADCAGASVWLAIRA